MERNKEHSAIQSSYKNRLNRLRESLNALMTKYSKLDSKYKQENQDLTEEYKRLTQQFRDLQDKYAHFLETDEAAHRDVWAMNEDEAKGLIRQILDCDKIIHEQALNIPWTSPSAEVLDPGTGEGQSETGTQTGRRSGHSKTKTQTGSRWGAVDDFFGAAMWRRENRDLEFGRRARGRVHSSTFIGLRFFISYPFF